MIVRVARPKMAMIHENEKERDSETGCVFLRESEREREEGREGE